ncbi:hypothetical protein HZB88_04575 [archaeon]|nr:hypothetical protein [archaeon]
MKYYELWIILWKWKKEFSVKEFISTFQTQCPNKILFDMHKKGFLEKTGRGMYKVISPEGLFKNRVNISKAYDLVRQIKLKYCFTEPDAVFFWTKGGYQVGRFFGFYPICFKILKSDLAKWKKILKARHINFYIRGMQPKETFFGIFYILSPKKDFKIEKINGFGVEPLKQTIEFCKKNIYQYEPALEMLNEMYNLKMQIKYRET